MALSNIIDVTTRFNADNGFVADLSGWDTLVAQFVGPTGTINITASNDGGDVQGVTDGNSLSATNFQTTNGVKMSDGTTVTAVAAAGSFRVGNVGRFVKFGGASAAATKVIFEYNKIS